MTTIATDGQTIACDGLATSEGLVLGRGTVKIVADAGLVFALAGNPGYFPQLRRWITEGADPERTPKVYADTGWELLVIGPHGAERYVSTLPLPVPVEYPTALGSGRSEAMAAMMANASPRRAVEIASQLDMSTGGVITVIDIAEALGIEAAPPRRRPQAAE